MDTQRLIAFVIFSFSALLLWDAWQKHNAPKAVAPSAGHSSVPAATPAPTSVPATSAAGAMPASAGVPPVAPSSAGQPVKVRTDLMEVEFSTQGGDIRKVTFLQVSSAKDRTKPLTLLEPDAKHFYVVQTGLLGEGLPTHLSSWTAEQAEYAMGTQDRLEVRFKSLGTVGAEVTKTYVFHRGTYAMEVVFEVANKGVAPLSPTGYFQFLRDGNPPSEEAAQTSAFAGVTTFTGPAVFTEESKFTKVDFSDITKGKQSHPKRAKDGWIGMVQHYFVSAWLPPKGIEREYYTSAVGDNRFSAGLKVGLGSVAPEAGTRFVMPLYIGPQETDKLEKLAPGLDLVVDYGTLYVLAAPLFWFLKWIHSVVGNWGWAIIILTVIIKLAFYPLNAKAGRSMAQMKVLAPKMEKLKQLYGDDRQKLNQAMMELYRTEKINPLGGCLPILVQIPVFIALYWVLLGSIELRQAPWLGWIQDLSAPDPYFILPVIYAISMLVQTKLNPQPADPVQARVMMAMPIVFSVFFLFFPAGLVLYWVVQNLLTIAQQWHINRTLEAEAKAKPRR